MTSTEEVNLHPVGKKRNLQEKNEIRSEYHTTHFSKHGVFQIHCYIKWESYIERVSRNSLGKKLLLLLFQLHEDFQIASGEIMGKHHITEPHSGRLWAECCWFMERLTRTSWAQVKLSCGWTLGVARDTFTRNVCSSFFISLLRKERFLGGLLNSYPTPESLHRTQVFCLIMGILRQAYSFGSMLNDKSLPRPAAKIVSQNFASGTCRV